MQTDKKSLKPYTPLLIVAVLLMIFVARYKDVDTVETSAKSDDIFILGDKYYMAKLKTIAEKCGYEPGCINAKARKSIPSKYYIHVRLYRSSATQTYWAFACIDTTKPGHEEELQKALKAAAGY